MKRWSDDTGEPHGEILTLPKTLTLARAWYVDRLDPDYRGISPERAREIFTSVGLTSDFWLA